MQLRSYQQRVIKSFYENNSILGVLKMGGGKTVSALTAVSELKRDGVIRHALVLAPKRVSELVWKQEAAKWPHTRHLDVEVLSGGPGERSRRLHRLGDRDVTVCGIDNVQWLIKEIEMAAWKSDHPVFDCLIIDETSRFKDPTGKRGHALRRLAPKFTIKWGLTGTPRPNSLMDLWGPMSILAPGLWPSSFYAWRKQHFYATDFQGYYWAVLPGHDDIIMAEAAPYTVTLAEEDMPDMPPLSVIEDEIVLPPAARAAYNEMEDELFARHAEGTVVAVSSAVATGKLAQIANGFVYDVDEDSATRRIHVMHGEKIEWLAEKKEELAGEPAIVVYEFVRDRDVIREVFPTIPVLGSGISPREAAAMVEAWNDRKIPYIALHPAAAGHGLNLQAGGSRMLWISPPWSPELWDQTLARLHRPGQSEHVMVHVCMARNTVDQLKRDRVLGKLSAQEAFEAYLRSRDRYAISQ